MQHIDSKATTVYSDETSQLAEDVETSLTRVDIDDFRKNVASAVSLANLSPQQQQEYVDTFMGKLTNTLDLPDLDPTQAKAKQIRLKVASNVILKEFQN